MSKTVNVIVDHMPPYLLLLMNDSVIYDVSGYVGDIWKMIEKRLDVRSNYMRSEFAGGKVMLKEKTGDLLLVPAIVTNSDIEDVDFSIPIFKSWYELYAMYTSNRATSLSYLVTWSPEVWIAFVLTMLVIVVCMWLVAKIRHLSNTSVDESTTVQQEEPPGLILYFFAVWGSICSQGLHTVSTEAGSVRVASWVTLLFGLCISTSYSAVLFSRLTVDKSDLVIPTLDSVARLRTHVLCVRRNSFAALYFKANEADTVVLEKWRGVVNEPPCPEYDYGDTLMMAKIVCNEHVLVLETPNVMARAMSDQDGCRVVSVAGRYAVAYASLLTSKGFLYTQAINNIILSIMTNGVADYLQKKWMSREFHDQPLTEADSIGATIGHVQGLLVVFGLSIVVATAIMLVELTVSRSKNSSKGAVPRPKFPRFYQ